MTDREWARLTKAEWSKHSIGNKVLGTLVRVGFWVAVAYVIILTIKWAISTSIVLIASIVALLVYLAFPLIMLYCTVRFIKWAWNR